MIFVKSIIENVVRKMSNILPLPRCVAATSVLLTCVPRDVLGVQALDFRRGGQPCSQPHEIPDMKPEALATVVKVWL